MTLRDGAWRRQRLADARLYLCTPQRDDLEAFLDTVLAAGVDIVQLRDKDAARTALVRAAETLRVTVERHEALFIVNDDPELAVEVGADGVHVGQDDPSPRDAREVVGDQLMIGRSTHDVGQVSRALKEDCDYFAVGPVHATPTKAGRPPAGLAPVRLAAAVARDKPWFAIGGMAPDTVPEVRAAGARRVVVVRAITDAADPGAAVAQLRAALEG
ncbi:MAG: thiamine phosphate synthase [Actinobacteria bacterium]|nr:thiamine phosphate synthase [Actinomycetota bacterium]